MKRIKLNRGQYTLVDDEDFERLNQFRWLLAHPRNGRYAMRYISRGDGTYTTRQMHRDLIDAPEGMVVDHIDRNGLNNQKSNLRVVTWQQNLWNHEKRRKCSSRFIGVYWNKRLNRWAARLIQDYKQIHLGHFKSEVEAAMAWNAAAKEHRGEYARLNEIPLRYRTPK